MLYVENAIKAQIQELFKFHQKEAFHKVIEFTVLHVKNLRFLTIESMLDMETNKVRKRIKFCQKE